MADTTPTAPKTLVPLKSKKPSPPAVPATAPHDSLAADSTRQQQDIAMQDPTNEPEGAAEAAGVLTAVDEDAEGGEEAAMPHDFDYVSDAYDDEEEEEEEES